MLKIRFGQKDSPLKLGPHTLTCYILEENKRVLTINSIQRALGYEGKSENWTVELIHKINAFTAIDTGISTAFTNAIAIEIDSKKKMVDHAVESHYFTNLCLLIIKAKEEGYLNVAQLKYAKAALQLINAIGKSDIEELIDTATGFRRFKSITLEYLAAYVKKQDNDPAYEWVKTIPIYFIEDILEMNQLQWEDVTRNPYALWELLNELLFSRISANLWEDLRESKPKRMYTRKDNKKQDIEHPKLKEYVMILHSLMKASGKNWNIFMQLLHKTYPKQKGSSKIVFADINKEKETYPEFDEKLKTVLNK